MTKHTNAHINTIDFKINTLTLHTKCFLSQMRNNRHTGYNMRIHREKKNSNEAQSLSETIISPEDNTPWYAIKLYTLKQKEIYTFLQEQGFTCFIPKHNVTKRLENGGIKKEIKPVVHNLIFVKKTMEESEMRSFMSTTTYKMVIMKKIDNPNHYCEIPATQMREFVLLCTPRDNLRKYITTEEAKLKHGDPVYVKHGPFKGMTGKLVRSSQKYFLLKEVPGMAVMVKISRWCCEPI